MPISSISLLRQHYPVFVSRPSCNFLRHVACRISQFSLSAPQNPHVSRKNQPDKNLLKAKDAVKEASGLSLNFASEGSLLPYQAVGFVAAAQANFMRVIVESTGPSDAELKNGSGNQLFERQAVSRVGTELLCVVRAVLKKIKRRVLVGDKVLVGSVDWVDRRGMIENVFPRNSEIVDPPVANVDHLMVLFSMEQPKLEPFLLTRFLVDAESTGIPVTLALNKVELVEEETLIAWEARLRAWGYEPLFCSVNSNYGLANLTGSFKGQTTVIVGPSGVGKSSLINVLRNGNIGSESGDDGSSVEQLFQREISRWYEDQRVGEVSARSGRGKHTTRHVSLLPLSGGGYLADTPGFNQPSLLKVTARSLANMFPEVRRMLSASESAKCAFNDCLHLGEPGCVVKGDWERYPYYLQLLDEIKIREQFQLRTLGTKRESDVRYKIGDMGIKQPEPRLEPKKHRRQSRKRVNQSILDDLHDLDEEDDASEFGGSI
ncbi:small ribosomal subunit biogenesis GTPase RsgA 1, mitochondrial [Aristolochia californica]|uniref:small ribosomal subunit biogenesis GTPase RsgA 1, mitochondrial n=1 Tax=Aristolochia californica TaxID=171875 RepID=UPI0035D9F512